jgi:hypothetical protein
MLLQSAAFYQKVWMYAKDREEKKKARRVESVFIELIEHYLYHAGQINYIRCLWEEAKEEP